MPLSIANVNINTDTWRTLVETFNDVVEGLNTVVVTSDGTPAEGDLIINGGIQANSAITVNSVPVALTTTTISAGTGLTGGGSIASNRTLALNSNTIALLDKANTALQANTVANVAISGSYNDLSNKPTYATVATTGSYTDLTSKPTLGSAASEDVAAFVAANTAVLLTAQTLTEEEQEQVKENIGIQGNGIPIGMICWFATDGDKEGFLRADGRSFDTEVYPQLAEVFPSGIVPNIANRVLRMVGDDTPDVGDTQEDAHHRLTGSFLRVTNGAAPANDLGAGDGVFSISSTNITGANNIIQTAANANGRALLFDSGNSPGTRVSDDETRVKSFIGVAYVKAYDGFIGEGEVDLVAIESAQEYMVRWDEQSLTDTAKAQIFANIIGAGDEGDTFKLGPSGVPTWSKGWETIFSGSLPTPAATYEFTNLDNYIGLELIGTALSSVSNTNIMAEVSTDNGASYITSASYQILRIVNNSNAATPSGMTLVNDTHLSLHPSATNVDFGAVFRLLLFNFYSSAPLYSSNFFIQYDKNNYLYQGIEGAKFSASNYRNALRFRCATGNIYLPWVLIRGIRG